MAILVTGGAGFIGSHLVERLLSTTSEPVVVLDNFHRFYDPARKRANLAAVLGHDRFTLVTGDIADASLVEQVWRRHRVTDVIHLAALAGVRPSLADPLPYVEANVRGTLVLLETARQMGCRRFLAASSATVYGNDAPAPFREDRLGSAPASPYGVTKRAAELLCRLYHDLHGVPTLSLRYFSAYGPRLRPDLAMSIFAEAILAGQPVPLFAGGDHQRDFTFIDDIIDGTVAAWQSTVTGDEVNLGHQQPIRIRRIVELLEQALGRTAQLKLLPEQSGEMRITCADTGKAERLFGYRPKVDIVDGVQRFVQWFVASRTSA